MTRREFRLISGQGAGPSEEDITKRPISRRHFKTIQTGGLRTENRIGSVTIKGIDKTDGTTVWEYGPGSFWRHHYGANAISGVVPNVSATLDKYAICAASYPSYNACGDRNAGTLIANVMEAVSVVKLNSLDGTTIESATLTGMFCGDVRPESFALVLGITIQNAAALSGGDYVIVGERLPFIEFVDYSSNTANKEYILHAHGQQNGNVYLKTRTSGETITIPQNATAAEVETLFEATSDCVAATATGGPWPLLPISIDVEWSVAGGDISGISATDTYSAEGLTVDWDYTNGNLAEGVDYLDVTVNIITIGAEFTFSFVGGADFSYTSTTDNATDFLADLAAAMEAFAIAQGTDSVWESVASGLPDSISVTGNTIRILYSTEIGIDPLSVSLTNGGTVVTDSRRAGSCAAAYDTGTGDMTSAVGYLFGMSEDRPTLRMFSDGGTNPSVTGLNVLAISSIGSGPDDCVIITPSPRGSGDLVKANVIERWDIAGGVWSFAWETYCNAAMLIDQIIPCESASIVCPIAYSNFSVDGPTTSGIVATADASVTPYLSDEVSTSATNNDSWSSALLYDGSSTSVVTYDYDVTSTGGLRHKFNAFGSETDCNGTAFLLGGLAIGSDGTYVFARSNPANTRVNVVRPDDYQESGTALQWLWTFLVPSGTRNGGTTQYRFRFSAAVGSPLPDVVTSWLDWDATASEIQTAIIAQFGENTAGGGSNAEVWPFGEPTDVDNAYISQLEKNLSILFRSPNGTSAEIYNYINAAYVGLGARTFVEIQTAEAFANPPGIAAYAITDASLIWSRAFGTRGATTISQPQYAWLQGDFVYAYGVVVDAEL